MQILALRSYGDYVILLNSIKHAEIKQDVKIIVSNHLMPLHEALNGNFSANFNFIFKDFGIKNGLMGFLTNKHFISLNTVYEILKISKSLKILKTHKQKLFLEHHKRKFLLSVFLGTKLDYIYKSGNVYDAFGSFFDFESIDKTFKISELHSKSKVLIFPDSRKKHKVINEETLNQLSADLTNLNVEFKIAKFGQINNESSYLKNQIVYRNFKELILLITECDFVISSDSVPIHIAEFLEKQHIILYNDKINYNWLTPFAKKYHMFSTFKETSIFINKYFN